MFKTNKTRNALATAKASNAKANEPIGQSRSLSTEEIAAVAGGWCGTRPRPGFPTRPSNPIDTNGSPSFML